MTLTDWLCILLSIAALSLVVPVLSRRARRPALVLHATPTPVAMREEPSCPWCHAPTWDHHGRAGHVCNPGATFVPLERRARP